jgi:hypothetical protein
MQAAAVIAVFALLSLNLPMPGFPRQLSNLLVVVVFAVVQAVVPQLVGFCRGLVPEPGVAVGDAIGFLLIWVPPAFLLGARDGTHVFVNKILMIACVAIAIALSIHLRTDGISARAAVACALAWLVPFLLPASPRPGS